MERFSVGTSVRASSRISAGASERPLSASERSTASPGLQVQHGHDYLLTGFYEGAFDLDYAVLGQVILNAKQAVLNTNNSSIQDLHDTFMLLGDPAMHMRTWEANSTVSLPLAIR